MEEKPNQTIILKGVGRIVLGILFITILFFMVWVPSRELWFLIVLSPFYLFLEYCYISQAIEEIFKELVKQRRDIIEQNYPLTARDISVNCEAIKEYKAFLRIPDSEWERREKENIQYEEERKQRRERICNELAEIEKLAPHGVDYWLKKNKLKASWREENRKEYQSYLFSKDYRYPGTWTLPEWAYEGMVVNAREEIFRYEDDFKRFQHDKAWLSSQKEFSHEMVAIIKDKLSFLGRYAYYAPAEILDEDFNKTEEKVRIWQFFFTSYCIEDDLDYLYFSRIKNLGNYLSGLPYPEDWVPPINSRFVNAAISLIAKALQVQDVAFVICEEDLVNSWFDSLVREQLREEPKGDTLSPVEQFIGELLYFIRIHLNNFPHYTYDELVTGRIVIDKVVFITALLKTEEIVNITKAIWERLPDPRPSICFLSLFKDLSREEVLSLISKKKQAIAAEEEKKRKEQELIDSIPSKVDGWEMLPTTGGLRIKYLLDYYPTTVEFEADDDEWNDRWTVWHFKNDSDKTSEKAHQHVLDRVILKFVDILNETFGEESLKYLTLVCIPASTQEKNDARYKEFSERLCRETGMENGFEHIQVTGARVAKHDGGEDENVNYSFDDSFFNGKRVILLDDIITKGNSMRIAKAILQKQGAKVICGLAVGKTRHERRDNMPEEEYA